MKYWDSSVICWCCGYGDCSVDDEIPRYFTFEIWLPLSVVNMN